MSYPAVAVSIRSQYLPRPTHEINADDELRFASRIVALHLVSPVVVGVHCLRSIAVACLTRMRLAHGVAGWSGLTVQLRLMLRWVAVTAASVDGRRHRTRWPALVRMPRSAQVPSLIGVLV